MVQNCYDTLEGTMYVPMRVAARMEVINKRALELKEDLELVKEGGNK